MECVNLKKKFGSRFKIGYDDANVDHPGDPWNLQIKCTVGHIAPSGGTLLWGSLDRPIKGLGGWKGTRNHLAQLATDGILTVKQDGDDGMSIEFDVKHFDAVSEFMKPVRA